MHAQHNSHLYSAVKVLAAVEVSRFGHLLRSQDSLSTIHALTSLHFAVKVPAAVEVSRFAHLLDASRRGVPNFFHALTGANNKRFVQTKFFRRAIALKWTYVRGRFWREFILYLIFVVITSVYTLTMRAHMIGDWALSYGGNDVATGEDLLASVRDELGNGIVVSAGLTGLFSTYFAILLIYKRRIARISLKEFYRDGWNMLAVGVYLSNFLSTFAYIVDIEVGRRVHAVAILLSYMGVFGYMKTPPQTAPLVGMILVMIADIAWL
jgi:hypothetical protein